MLQVAVVIASVIGEGIANRMDGAQVLADSLTDNHSVDAPAAVIFLILKLSVLVIQQNIPIDVVCCFLTRIHTVEKGRKQNRIAVLLLNPRPTVPDDPTAAGRDAVHDELTRLVCSFHTA